MTEVECPSCYRGLRKDFKVKINEGRGTEHDVTCATFIMIGSEWKALNEG